MRWAAPLSICVVSACGPAPQSTVDAAERAEPHLPAFERFERWVARAADGSAVMHEQAALSEAVFAPMRRADGVLGAWVHVPGRPALDLALPSKSVEPSLQNAVQLREAGETPELLRPAARGALWVQVQRSCAFDVAAKPGSDAADPADDCILLAREARTPAGPLRVIAAFRSLADEAEEARDQETERE